MATNRQSKGRKAGLGGAMGGNRGGVAGSARGGAAGGKRGGAGRGAPAEVGKARGGAAGAADLLEMDEAVALLKTTRPTFYRWLRSGKIKGMKLGRQWRFYRDDVERFLKGEGPRIDLPADITPLIRTLSARVTELGGKLPPPDEAGELRDAAKLMILIGALSSCSDIHITCHVEGTQNVAVVRHRIDGVLHETARIDMRLLPAVVEEWKRMAACDVHEKEKPQDGRILMDFREVGSEKLLDLRVSFLPTALGESLTVRILDRAAVDLRLDRIDYAPADRERILRALHAQWGLIVCTGPVGSGKTTVLYSCLTEIARPEIKVMSVEDPVEFLLPWVTQVAVRESVGLTYERAVWSILRSDPDVILIGEMRDLNTLIAALKAALTGHIVMTTLHTNDAASALKRMVDMGGEPFVIGDSTKLVIAQRLVRQLCPHCSVGETPDANRLDRAAGAARAGGLNWNTLQLKFRKAVGCDKCGKTGFRGRTVIAETLEVTGEIGRALRNGASTDELRALAVSQGMTTMAADGVRRAAAGVTTLDEILRVVG